MASLDANIGDAEPQLLVPTGGLMIDPTGSGLAFWRPARGIVAASTPPAKASARATSPCSLGATALVFFTSHDARNRG
jgi:hypothetical protein